MDKNFDFARCEKEINAKWLDGNMFAARVNPDKQPYTIIMPPPNITSRLHIGHAYDMSIQDFIIRFKRMQGFEALLLPGADHAAIATEVKVAEELKKQGIEKKSLSREEFLSHIEKWYKTYTEQIVAQVKRLGVSCDWSRFAFTMDKNTSHAVKHVFTNLQKKGLVYRGERMTNWCPSCRTALSDAEVVYAMQPRQIYEVRYGDIVVATTRPETMFGDVAIAVNPTDKRYQKFIGKSISLPLTKRSIPVIADEYVDIKFGTGALKITPAHDHADNQIGLKHGLEIIKTINEEGKLFGDFVPQEYVGLSVEEARKRVVKALNASGLLVSTKPYSSNVGKCYRCGAHVEPTVSTQWFVKMKELAEPCITALGSGLVITPKKYEKIYLHWLRNIKDWCISRQLLSGHRVPVEGETDVLDTWFSSALWPFCTLDWPNTESPDFKYFYPTQTMVTAYDILFFWVIRMVFSGIEHTGKLPFNTVLFHGLVRDIEGRKMSKSLGNGIDPVDIIEKFGTDALRFSLVCGTKLDRDPRYSAEKAELARNFINKIWNATKFYLTLKETSDADFSIADKWILTKLNGVIKSATKKYEKFDFGVAANELQSFFWNDFCDWYIEASKVAPNRIVFEKVLLTFLKLINPIMPFVTEQIYCNELLKGDTLLFEKFPIEEKKFSFAKEKKQFERLIELVQVLRAARKENPELEGVYIEPIDEYIQKEQTLLQKLSGTNIEFKKIDKSDIVVACGKVKLLINSVAASKRVAEKVAFLKAEIARGEKMLSNEGFMKKAPSALVESEKSKLEENKKMLEKILKS